jgi:glycosyltransferase involved in cell wall biosynthesis
VNPVRVLWVTKGLGLGGAERLLSLMAPRFDPTRFTIDVAYLLPWKDAFVADLEQGGAQTICLGARRTVDAAWVSRLRSLVRGGEYGVIHTHSPVPAAAVRFFSPRSVPVVHTEHNVWDRYRWPTYAVNAMSYGRNDAVLAVSEGVADSIVRPRWAVVGSPPPVEVLLHGVEPSTALHGPAARADARAELGLDDSTPVVGTVANFTPKKDHLGLLRAMDAVRRHIPGAQLLLIGTGPLEAELRHAVEQHGLAENVRFLGSRADVPTLLPALDVFVLGSRFEGLPISLLEAMAANVACVATRVGGIPEAIDDGRTGLLVEPGHPDVLAEAIVVLLSDPATRARLARGGRDRVAADFSIERSVRRTQDLYAALLAERSV